MEYNKNIPLCPANAALLGYTFVRHIGFMLDELSSQGLDLWRDEQQRWHWRWLGTPLQAERGFWAIGEAVVDAVVTRYPGAFAAEVGEGVA
ncbi:MAG: hypothetical protein MI924_32320 [Chloroflexales bacterium]|nr:hypothetical protein [Chloroflexales bacterium]